MGVTIAEKEYQLFQQTTIGKDCVTDILPSDKMTEIFRLLFGEDVDVCCYSLFSFLFCMAGCYSHLSLELKPLNLAFAQYSSADIPFPYFYHSYLTKDKGEKRERVKDHKAPKPLPVSKIPKQK